MALNSLNYPVNSSAIDSSSSIQLSELTLRRLQSIQNPIDDDNDTAQSDQVLPVVLPVQESNNVILEFEDELSEQQLRELYDSEEIDRFLDLFSAVSVNQYIFLPCRLICLCMYEF